MNVSYLGPESSFTYQAACQLFPTEQLTAYASIPACLRALFRKQVDLAVVPVENSLEGSVHHTIDLLSKHPEVEVKSEIVLPILETHYPNVPLVATESTTAAAMYVAEHPKEDAAAIASLETAQHVGLEILAENIQDNELNQTRFWIVGDRKMTSQQPAPVKMSVILTLPANRPGMLHKMLAAFGWREINLSKIESRPLKTSLGEYFFVIDLLLDRPMALVENALQEIKMLGGNSQILGCYPVLTVE
ncbi:prephenate dehydratase [Enterococcus faecium]|nr:prephenate dehydratase [Enterococcus faecium]